MPIVISVHGTSDTGLESGERWWQRGGAFESDLKTFVEGENGEPIDFRPFIWDGKNSETSRRVAGSVLLQRLLSAGDDPAQKTQPCCVIGHSHGGSVLAHALLEATIQKRELRLARWVTVGAPFIQTAKKPSRFARLGLVGRAAYLTAITFLIPPMVTLLLEWEFSLWFATELLQTLVQYGLPFATFVAVTDWLDRSRYKRYQPTVLTETRVRFDASWFALNHRNDEAVQGLVSVERFEGKIFNRRLLVAPLQFAVLLLFPILIAGGLLGSQFDWQTAFPFLRHPAFEVFRAILGYPYVWAVDTFQLDRSAPRLVEFVVEEIVFIGLVPAVLVFALALLTLAIVYWPAVGLSFATTRSLDPVTWRQIRQTAMGNDTSGEMAIRATDVPAWTKAAFAPLPDAVGDGLSAHADKAAGLALAKFRSELSKLASGQKSHESFIADYITWNELVHTAYFRDALFRKLACYAIAGAPGFRATEALRNDPDFACVEACYAQVVRATGT